MSIKGIDSQIMIARTADVSRDTSALQKRPEVTQEYLAIREKLNDAHDQSRVVKSNDSQKPELRADDGSGGGGHGGHGRGSGKNSQADESETSMLVPPGDSVIDIMV